VRCLDNTISPDIITVMTLPAWQVFCQISHTFSKEPDDLYFQPTTFNGSTIVVLADNTSQFFFYTLCRNIPKPL
jgi:hypothetical protein